jgi:hypothetical protein
MFNFKRSVLAAGFMAVAALASVSMPAQAAGGGGGAGIDSLTISPSASLVAKLAVSVTVTYTCQPVFDPSTNTFIVNMSSSAFGSVQEKTGGHTVANGSGIANATAVCNEHLTATPTVNTITVLVQPTIFPTASGPFKNGTALASTSVVACPKSFGFPLPCDFGNAGPIVISIK